MGKAIPTWILIWGFLMALLPLGFSLVGYFNPGFFGEQYAHGDASLYGGVLGLYVGRDMASVLVTLIALQQRSAAMLIMAFFLRITTDLFDGVNKVISGTLDQSFLIDASILIIVSSVAIYKLWPIYRSEK